MMAYPGEPANPHVYVEGFRLADRLGFEFFAAVVEPEHAQARESMVFNWESRRFERVGEGEVLPSSHLLILTQEGAVRRNWKDLDQFSEALRRAMVLAWEAQKYADKSKALLDELLDQDLLTEVGTSPIRP